MMENPQGWLDHCLICQDHLMQEKFKYTFKKQKKYKKI